MIEIPASEEVCVLGSSDESEWDEALACADNSDFYHSLAYHRLAEGRGEGFARFFVYRKDEYLVAIPLLLRAVNEAAGLENVAADWMDATSVYGYAGPVASHSQLPEDFLRSFRGALHDWLRGMRVVTVFSRLHPLMRQHGLLAGLGDCVTAGQTVSMDLLAGADAQTRQYRSDHRRDIAYLRELGVACIYDKKGEYLPAFIEMYLDTMRRVGARPGYLFEKSYFEGMASSLGVNVHLFVCLYEGVPISAALITTANGIVQGHLSGAAEKYRKLASKKLLIDTVRQWATERGYRSFHLGGGVSSRCDSLFDFKAGFSQVRHEFSTWRWVLEPEIFRELCETRARWNAANGFGSDPDGFFPEYRAGTGALTPATPAGLATTKGAKRGTFRELTTEDHEEWTDVLGKAVRHDFYHLPQYHRLAENRGEGTARLFVYREGRHMIALPLLVRPISDAEPGGWKDATSVYGYGGPIASGADLPASMVHAFHEALREAAAAQRIVSVFSRLHPLIVQRELLTGIGEIRPCGRTVSIDLGLSSEAQRAQYSGTYRTRINKLTRSGAVCSLDSEQRHLPDFVEMYHETMRRVSAHTSYFFDADYFEQLSQGLGPALNLFIVQLDGRMIGAALFTLCDGIVQYHLGATGNAYLRLSPMGLIIDTVRAWGCAQGARVLHLGGGVGSKEDSLFEFKAGFSNTRHHFETWRWVAMPKLYSQLNEERSITNRLKGLEAASQDFFPAYRCPSVPRVETQERIASS